jgi:hypothetical protein
VLCIALHLARPLFALGTAMISVKARTEGGGWAIRGSQYDLCIQLPSSIALQLASIDRILTTRSAVVVPTVRLVFARDSIFIEVRQPSASSII